MNKDGLFQVTYEDKTEFIGSLFQKDWCKVSDVKRIKEIIFTFGNKSIKMENCREYNLTFETHSIIGKGNKIANITLAGRCDNKSILIIYDMAQQKIIRKNVDKYKEYRWISSTWKKGVATGIARDYHG